MNATKLYLESVCKIRQGQKAIGDYTCLEHFILENGHEFKSGPKSRPRSIKKMKDRYCFQNCYELSLERRNLQYAEGFAVAVIPTIHAWCINKRSKVIDPTWDNGQDYIGVIIPRQLMVGTALTRGSYGVLDNWEQHWPLLRYGIDGLLKLIEENKFLGTFNRKKK